MIDERRFSVRADAFYVRHDDGVWLRNNIGSFSIRGASAYELVGAVFANLDGRRTVADICAGLPENARTSVSRLVDTLAGNGFLREVRHDPEPVPAWMSERYAAHLAFLDHHADRPVARFLKARSALIGCVGDGVALRGLLSALAEFGLARVRVESADADAPDLVAELGATDPGFRWELGTVADADVVLVATDKDSPAAADVPVTAPVGVLGRCGEYVVAVPPGVGRDWCWECVHRSIAVPVAVSAADHPPAAAPATIGALHLAQHTFARLADITLPTADTVTSVEPVAPAVRSHTGRRHPLCGRHPRPADHAARPTRVEAVRPDIAASTDSAESIAVSDRIVAVTTAWTDQVAGPLHSLGEGGLEQVPVSASSCLVADPASTASAPDTRLVVCRALAAREARNQAVLFAVEWLVRRTAEVLGEPVDGFAVGAGWTWDEAVYRARLTAAAALPPTSLSWRPAADTDHPVGDFLAETLRAEGRPWCATSVEPLAGGLVRARVRTTDFEVATAIGVDDDHAVRSALLHAVTAGSDGHTAHLAPPEWLTGDVEPVDLARLVPFLGADAAVVGVRLPGVGR
ncbi:hypothetical protein [Actinokineospora fastidiosa]|uniref:Uncharacterized protein n=1 Tax=Actinokineospora fastidiosa TaxID=1816 RepID=A0A918GMU6_9PSEU|nr:hypothetical protein [Actinokineospora fastidiosa]GGS46049.1 hypothetical protein GCM10010171_46540 [Actinokineospora fastidiosa]